MAQYSAWKGALELAGVQVNVKLFPRTKSRRTESFKMLAPDGNGGHKGPIKQVLVDQDGERVERAECLKGVKIGRNEDGDIFAALSEEGLELIEEQTKSVMVSPTSFCPAETLPFDLAITTYVVTPDEDVPGAEGPVNILWNGLRADGLAYLTQVTMRSGSPDAIMAVYVKDDVLCAATFPYEAEIYSPPTYEFEVDNKAAKRFAQFVKGEYEVKPFDHSSFESHFAERREQAIRAAVDGAPVPKKRAHKHTEVPDLMAALDQSIQKAKRQSPAKPKPRTKKSRKKVTA